MTLPRSRPAGLLVDIGGTLLREDSYELSSGVRALDPLRATEELIWSLEAAIGQVRASNSSEFTVTSWLTDNRASFPVGRSIAELELALWTATAKLSPMPGVEEALSDLRRSGLWIGCLSNSVFSGPVMHSELVRHELEVDFVLSSADLAIRKPDTRAFSAALSKMGLPASAAWFVGDSWLNDICGAADAGLFPVWLSQSEEPLPATPVCARVTSWSELSAMIAGTLECS